MEYRRMVDTERFQLGPELIHHVTTLAACVAVERGGPVSPLQVATYLPVDAESVARVLESVQDDYEIDRIEKDGICFFQFADPESHAPDDLDLDAGDHLEYVGALENNLASLKSGNGWSRKVREQHEVLRLAGAAEERQLDLSYFFDRSDVSGARTQSILNDFGAEGYVAHAFDEDEDEALHYTFPALDYPEERFETNMELLEELGESESSRRVWGWIGGVALVLLVALIVLRFYTV